MSHGGNAPAGIVWGDLQDQQDSFVSINKDLNWLDDTFDTNILLAELKGLCVDESDLEDVSLSAIDEDSDESDKSDNSSNEESSNENRS
eukprot:15367110-Ditylum_brightwellii.AAC.1